MSTKLQNLDDIMWPTWKSLFL